MIQGAHLSESELAAFLEGRLDSASRRQAVVHLESCDECRGELLATHDLATGYETASRTHSRRWLRIGAAIAAGLAGILLVRGQVGPRGHEETVRAPVIGSADAAPPIIAVVPRDGAVVTPAGLRFTWRAYDADSYRFMLLEEDGTPAWTTDTHDTSLILPAEILLAPGKTYFWRVDALADGITATTGTLRVQVPR